MTWKDDVLVKINVNYLRINISGIKKKIFYFVRFNRYLLVTNQEKTSLMQDSIIDRADYACSGKMNYIFEYHPHRNYNGCQGIWR